MSTLTKAQWFHIHDQHLGLRSDENPTVATGSASYAMDMGLIWIKHTDVPEEWDRLLIGTLETMQAFPNYRSRHLMIVTNSCGSGIQEYSGCFPKCSAKPQYLTSTSLDNDLTTLREWVLKNIPG